ncbi:Acyl-CoA reductase [Handroanthus impetiginosus]|uniref:Fatty acyl-CoA reductase n=1 Tax=Handroanthus impetiginosus TaxID=429701 RepID=A0A2G9GQS7_9LAMI|nr:Acyl-CoA reductase [Handroanthus impetiginosus]
MEANRIVQNLEGKTVLVTGATGFLAKILVEKILRVQPNVKKLFLLIRSSNVKSAEQRLHHEKMKHMSMYMCLSIHKISIHKTLVFSGDISHPNLGITDKELRNEMWGEIDFIINSAATTTFDERYDVAMDINAFGAMNVLNFAKNCSKLKLLLHISTAFVQGTRSGLLLEKPFLMGETLEVAKIPYLDINAEKKLVEERKAQLQAQNMTEKELTSTLKDLGIERATLHGWPNTYSFTKAMGEMLLESFKEDVHVIIVRAPIISSTWREPFPGWMEGLRTLDSIFVAYAKGKLKVFLGNPDSTLDVMPGDMLVNSMLVAMASQSSQELKIYHVGSSLRNPIKFKELKWIMYHYLKKNPLVDNGSKPIKVGKPTILSSMASFQRYIKIHYLPFLKILKFLNVILCNHYESSYSNSRRKINHAMRLAKLYKPYLFFEGRFDDANAENLRMSMRLSNENLDMFGFDPTSIRWEEYFINTHFPGIVKYVLK